MNKKLIATAVAGTLVSPLALAEAEVYLRVNNAVDVLDVDGADTRTDIRNVSSRFGIRGSADLGNGMTASGRYEFATFTDIEGNRLFGVDVDGDGVTDAVAGSTKPRGGVADTRLGWVSLSGGFGSVTVGNQWSAFFNMVGTHMDPTYTLGYYLYSSEGGGPYRVSNNIKYANSFGPVSLEVDARFAKEQESPLDGTDVEKIGRDHGEDFLDGFGIGLNWDAGFAGFGLAYDTELYDVGDDEDRVGVGVSVPFLGNYRAVLAFQNYEQDSAGTDVDHIQFWLHGSWGDTTGSVGFGQVDNDVYEPAAINLGIYHAIAGGPLKVYYESIFFDGDDGRADFNQHLFGMRIDI